MRQVRVGGGGGDEAMSKDNFKHGFDLLDLTFSLFSAPSVN